MSSPLSVLELISAMSQYSQYHILDALFVPSALQIVMVILQYLADTEAWYHENIQPYLPSKGGQLIIGASNALYQMISGSLDISNIMNALTIPTPTPSD